MSSTRAHADTVTRSELESIKGAIEKASNMAVSLDTQLGNDGLPYAVHIVSIKILTRSSVGRLTARVKRH
jgi:hypothetical protein